MAEFSLPATQLSAPQGAGSQPVAAVQEQYVDTSMIKSNAVSGIVDIFSKGLVQTRKEDAAKLENNIVGQYVREETAINNAIASGQMTPAAASARSRANFNKYAAGYPQYLESFEKSGKALRGFTEAGEVQDQIKSETEQRNKDISTASSRGYTFTPGMSKATQDDQIQAAKTAIRYENEMSELYKRNAERRAQGNFDQTLADRDAKDLGLRAINDIAGSQLTAFQSLGMTLREDMTSNKITPEIAQARLTERFSNISAAIQSAAGINPELAGPYRSIFNDTNDIFKKMLDPKSVSEGLEDQLKIQMTKLKLVAMSEPKFAATVVTSNLLGNTPELALVASGQAQSAIARISQVGGGTYSPQVVGNPDVEPEVLAMLKNASGKLMAGKANNPDKTRVEATNSVNTILKQTGEFLDRGANPQQLKGLAEFFASPEYAGIVTGGKIDQEAAGAAKRTFQLSYEPTIIRGVQQRLTDFVGAKSTQTFDVLGMPTSSTNNEGAKTVNDVVQVNFTGSGITFVPKNLEGLSSSERVNQMSAMRDLQSAQKAVNQLIHMGAHMEGTTNYAKYWEDNKHIYMPSMFSKYQGLNIGDVKNGWKFKGGEANDRNNWEQVNGE